MAAGFPVAVEFAVLMPASSLGGRRRSQCVTRGAAAHSQSGWAAWRRAGCAGNAAAHVCGRAARRPQARGWAPGRSAGVSAGRRDAAWRRSGSAPVRHPTCAATRPCGTAASGRGRASWWRACRQPWTLAVLKPAPRCQASRWYRCPLPTTLGPAVSTCSWRDAGLRPNGAAGAGVSGRPAQRRFRRLQPPGGGVPVVPQCGIPPVWPCGTAAPVRGRAS